MRSWNRPLEVSQFVMRHALCRHSWRRSHKSPAPAAERTHRTGRYVQTYVYIHSYVHKCTATKKGSEVNIFNLNGRITVQFKRCSNRNLMPRYIIDRHPRQESAVSRSVPAGWLRGRFGTGSRHSLRRSCHTPRGPVVAQKVPIRRARIPSLQRGLHL